MMAGSMDHQTYINSMNSVEMSKEVCESNNQPEYNL